MDASRRFFEAALAPVGYEISFESPELVDMQAAGRNDFGLVRRDPVGPTVHLSDLKAVISYLSVGVRRMNAALFERPVESS